MGFTRSTHANLDASRREPPPGPWPLAPASGPLAISLWAPAPSPSPSPSPQPLAPAYGPQLPTPGPRTRIPGPHNHRDPRDREPSWNCLHATWPQSRKNLEYLGPKRRQRPTFPPRATFTSTQEGMSTWFNTANERGESSCTSKTEGIPWSETTITMKTRLNHVCCTRHAV